MGEDNEREKRDSRPTGLICFPRYAASGLPAPAPPLAPMLPALAPAPKLASGALYLSTRDGVDTGDAAYEPKEEAERAAEKGRCACGEAPGLRPSRLLLVLAPDALALGPSAGERGLPGVLGGRAEGARGYWRA